MVIMAKLAVVSTLGLLARHNGSGKKSINKG
jgi:hypothetical protein